MSNYKEMNKTSALSGNNASFVESLYESFLEDASSVAENWQAYFKSLQAQEANTQEKPRLVIQDKFEILSKLPKTASVPALGSNKQALVNALINAYRDHGHAIADTDPIHLRQKPAIESLDYQFHGLTQADLNDTFDTRISSASQPQMKLSEIIDFLKSSYTRSIGLESSHLNDEKEQKWLQDRVEKWAQQASPTANEKKHILTTLVKAEGMERYLHTRYVGQKRFSLEGGESLIPMMDRLIQQLSTHGTKEILFGMAHRGRLNMLVNILGKSGKELFDEFEGRCIKEHVAGDVKYHMGYSSDLKTENGNVHLVLAYNPSHLEIVNPTLQGSARARLERRKKASNKQSIAEVANEVVAVQIHGDAAFANQGVIQESLQLSKVRGYESGGTVHLIVNNQIGFTTSNLEDARSSSYCSDPAKLIQAPVLHVNGDDPEAVSQVANIAADYVTKYNKDIFVDLVCYRRLGHNEADEPAATQPVMYQNIRSHDTTLTRYADKLINEKIISKDAVEQLKEDYKNRLDAGEKVADAVPCLDDNNEMAKVWANYKQQDWHAPVDTGYDKQAFIDLAQKVFSYPDSFKAHRIVEKLYQTRRGMADGEALCDWGFAENMAYATLLSQGYQVRLSGEDCGRGTFAHRHAVIHDSSTGKSYLPLAHIKADIPPVNIIDSILSEEAVLGFEYGFAQTEPGSLTVWEAQFGDFANGAQVLFDQFISSCETKWERYCGLTVLLPHGYEGQGPEHSSARIERYLQLCAENNMRVCVPTTPAQIFHLLRLQMLQNFRKPLIVISPKSLLRHKLAVSSIDDLSSGSFKTVIPEIDSLDNDKVERVVFCSGKVYYDLLEKRREKQQQNVAIVRLEQLYPFPAKGYADNLQAYPNAKEIVWTQEEPQNQGAWRNILHHLNEHNVAGLPLRYVGRKESASTASGYASVHAQQQAALVTQALDI